MFQLPPAFVVLKILPSEVPAKAVELAVGTIASELTFTVEVKGPLLTADQLAPASVVLNTPPPPVPA